MRASRDPFLFKATHAMILLWQKRKNSSLQSYTSSQHQMPFSIVCDAVAVLAFVLTPNVQIAQTSAAANPSSFVSTTISLG